MPALSEQYKDQVKTWVPKARLFLQEDFEAQLRRLGLKPDGRHRPLDRMSLPDAAAGARRRVEALLRRDAIGEGSAERGFDSVVRELSYTLLNRLLGLKAMEARGLLYLPPPSEPSAPAEQTDVVTPIEGQAYSRYVRDFRAAGGNRYRYDEDAEEALLHDALTSAFRVVTDEIRILFDPDHEYSCLWPSYSALTEIIRRINQGLPPDAYRAPDFLGWVYQFFRQHENDELREENKGTPRTSYELGVMNQFYTPGWVVKALVDNTLGRLWVQMHPDSSLAPAGPPPLPDERDPDLVAFDYLVPRTGEKIRYRRLTEAGEVETFKRARDIALLDPACGTMHFGQYAFQLFHRMYLEEIDKAGTPGWPPEPSIVEAKQIPAAILDNNLFGIDIDPRAIQIASLSLLLTAKEAAILHGFSPLEVLVRRSNLVVANTVGVAEERVRGLVERIFHHQGTKDTKKPLVPWSLGGEEDLAARLFTTLWQNLQNVPELGSLVQVREGVSQVLADWVETRAREKGLTKLVHRPWEQPQFAVVEKLDRQRAQQMELERRILEDEARQLEAELLAGLEEVAAEATGDPADHLFAEDTARGLKLIQMLSRRYDIVVMNPPYGHFVPKVKDYVRAAYPLTCNDIYAAFIDRATMLIEPEGYVGALVSRTFVTHKSHERLRTQILLKRNPLLVLLDLGEGILEATVQTAAIVTRGSAQ